MAFDITSGSNLLKKVYLSDYYDNLINDARVVMALIKKDEAFTGASRELTFKSAYLQTVSTDFASAQTLAVANANAYVRGSITGLTKHAPCAVSGDLIALAGDDEGSYLRPVREAIDSSIQNLSNRLAAEIMGSGWGDIGTIAAISGATITVANQSDMVKFEKGQVHVFSSAQSTATLRNSGGTLVVLSVDRDSKIVTYNANVSTDTGVSVGDYIFNNGDRDNSATPARKCVIGMQGWIPPFGYSFASDNFLGIDRSADPQRLAGHRLDCSDGRAISQSVQDAATEVAGTGGKLDHFIVNPKTFNKLAIELGQRVRMQPIQKGSVGFSGMTVMSPVGDITVLSDRFQPEASMMGIKLDAWRLLSKGKVVHVDDSLDGLMILRDGSSDSVQARIVYRNAQLVCLDPSSQINVKLA